MAADMTVPIDGNLTLEQTKDRCEIEQNKGFQLQSIERTTIFQGGEALMVNNADFVSTLDRLKTLLFVEPGGSNPETIKQQKKAENWTFLCSGPIFVKNTITNVMVFAK